MSGSRPRKKRPAEVPSIPIGEIDEAKRSVFSGIGYKNPPRATRFKKGQSGNPKGRPKSRDGTPRIDRSASELILKEAERLVTVREGEQVKQITAIEAVIRAQVVSASRGNSHAQRNFIAGYEQGKRERQAEIAERVKFWRGYVGTARGALDRAVRNGEPPPKLLPHPDDVVFEGEQGVRIIGPIDEHELRRFEELIAFRDLHLMQDALEIRVRCRTAEDRRSTTPLLFADIVNSTLPPRLRLSDTQLEIRMGEINKMTKRQLLKSLHRGWRSAGLPRPRGWMYPSLDWGRRVAELCFDIVSSADTGRWSMARIAQPLEGLIQEARATGLAR